MRANRACMDDVAAAAFWSPALLRAAGCDEGAAATAAGEVSVTISSCTSGAEEPASACCARRTHTSTSAPSLQGLIAIVRRKTFTGNGLLSILEVTTFNTDASNRSASALAPCALPAGSPTWTRRQMKPEPPGAVELRKKYVRRMAQSFAECSEESRRYGLCIKKYAAHELPLPVARRSRRPLESCHLRVVLESVVLSRGGGLGGSSDSPLARPCPPRPNRRQPSSNLLLEPPPRTSSSPPLAPPTGIWKVSRRGHARRSSSSCIDASRRGLRARKRARESREPPF